MDQFANEGLQSKPERAFMKRYGFSLTVLALCLLLGGYLLYSQHRGEELPVQGQGAEFNLTDSDGQPVTLSGTNGKARLLYFFFANCPDVCPPTTALLSQVQDELKADGVFGKQVEFMSVTIDPTRDTPDALKKYADTFHADAAGWKFLRGSNEQETAKLAGKYEILVNKVDGNFGHMNLIVLLDKKGRIRDYISAADYIENGDKNLTPKDMAKLIKSVL
jgi:protein SCO1